MLEVCVFGPPACRGQIMDLQTGADNNDFENFIWMIFWRHITYYIILLQMYVYKYHPNHWWGRPSFSMNNPLRPCRLSPWSKLIICCFCQHSQHIFQLRLHVYMYNHVYTVNYSDICIPSQWSSPWKDFVGRNFSAIDSPFARTWATQQTTGPILRSWIDFTQVAPCLMESWPAVSWIC